MMIGSENEMIEFAQDLATKLQRGDLICLSGEIGSGKSVLARALIRSLAEEPELEVPSPSFTLVQEYQTPIHDIIHIDAYRLSGSDEFYELGWPDFLDDHIVIVEWPDRLGELTPQRRLDIQISDLGGDMRRLDVQQIGEWAWTISKG